MEEEPPGTADRFRFHRPRPPKVPLTTNFRVGAPMFRPPESPGGQGRMSQRLFVAEPYRRLSSLVATTSPDLVRQPCAVGECGAMSAYILEIKAVVLRGEGPVGYGVDEGGHEFAVALDSGLAADIAKAIDAGQRPIVAVETPLYPPTTSTLTGRVVSRSPRRG